jgi:hypothetical protein
MGNGKYFYSERALIWFDPDTNMLAIDIFDINRSEFNALPSTGADHVVKAGKGDEDNLMWSKLIKTPARFTLSMYTSEPPIEESTP